MEDLSFSLRYIKRWDRKLIEDADANTLDMDALMDEGKLVWTAYVPTDIAYQGKNYTFYNQVVFLPGEYYTVNPPGNERDYDSVEIILNKRPSRGWGFMASYIWQKTNGLIGTDFDDDYGARGYYDSPNWHINSVGRMKYERRHQFKLQAFVKGPWGINIGTYTRYLSGQRYNMILSAYDLGLFLNQGDVEIYGEPRGSYGLPDVMIVDVKLEKEFWINNIGFSVFLDGFNIFNNNKAIEVEDIASSPVLEFGEMTRIQAPRILRIGAKFQF
jgi:hypothetical protein